MINCCSLDPSGRRAQIARYFAVGASALSIERAPNEIRVTLGPDLDRRVLDELVATERECCPFYDLRVTDETFIIGVFDEEFAPALEAIAELLLSRREASSTSRI